MLGLASCADAPGPGAPGGGCAHDALADGTPCEDGELCTLPDTCQAGSCKIGPTVCDYSVTSLADTEETDPFTGKPIPTAGTLRAALFNAENARWTQSGKGLATGTRVVRFSVGGKLTLAKPLPAVFFDKSIESGAQTILLDGGGATQGLYIHGGTTTLKGLKFQNFFVDKSSLSPSLWPVTLGQWRSDHRHEHDQCARADQADSG